MLVLFLQCTTEEGTPSPPGNSNTNNNVSGNFDPAADLHVIFLGNSLTYENDLPSLVVGIAEMDGVKLGIKTIAEPNYSFDDHWIEGIIQKTLKANHYDFLIGQQGPSALPESQALLRESSIRIGNECRAANTTFGLYMVWPSLARDFDRENSIASYTNAAKASDALLCPAGLAWKLAWQKDSRLPLYGPDNFHPSIHGSVLAAMVIYASIKEKKDLEFIDKSKSSWGKSISDGQFGIMKDAAMNAIRNK